MSDRTIIEVPGLADSAGYAYAQCATAGDFCALTWGAQLAFPTLLVEVQGTAYKPR